MESQRLVLPATHGRRPLLDTAGAAEYIGVTPRTLEFWRTTQNEKIPYIKTGRLVRYDPNDLDRWLEMKRIGGEWIQRELDVDTDPLPEPA